MRGVRFITAGMLIFLLAVSPCASAANATDMQVKAVAEPILDNILDSFKFDDYFKYKKDLDSALRVPGSSTKFYKINRYVKNVLGPYQDRQYMGVVCKGEIVIVLWKGMFEKSGDDILIKLMLARKNGKFVVTGLWLQ
ncbi:MAG: hypothetical protein ABII88_03345 [Candidatus Omnitrophota bacterium]